jgi:hypothetical protein
MKTLKRDGSLEMAFDRMMLKLEELEKRALTKKENKDKNLEVKTKKSTKNSSKKS